MAEEKLICPICGSPTVLVYGKYPRKDRMCKEHSLMVLNKEIEQCEKCGRWNQTGKQCTCKSTKVSQTVKVPADGDTACIICGEPSKGKPQCRNCYSETTSFMRTFVQERDYDVSLKKLKEQYQKIQEQIIFSKDVTETKKQCNQLIAMGMLANDNQDDSDLLEQAYKDAKRYIEGKKTPIPPADNNYERANGKTEENKEVEESTPFKIISIDKGIRCITCGYETDGKLFCKKCYSRYCDKEILIKIKNCKEIIPLDDFYEGYYECDDGHVVKSMAERDIDDYLFAHNIKHGYETALVLQDNSGKRITLHPDFCVFDEHSRPLYYIEYWGYDDSNRDYTKTKKFKMPLYEEAGITLININAKTDLRNLKTNLQFKLNNFVMGKINFTNE